jgi:RNA polymerase-binding transcription factor DksA
MSQLNPQDIERLQDQLDRREMTLRAEVKAVREESADAPRRQAGDLVEDFGEQGEERIREAVRYAEQERDIEELRDIADARERIVAGTYGDCLDCGRDIPLQRLQAQPAARRCIACQEKFEHSHPASPRFPASL